MRKGDTWKATQNSTSPLAGPQTFEFRWRVESVTSDRIELSFSGDMPTGISAALKGGAMTGTLRFDRANKIPELMRTDVKLELNVGDGATSHSTIETRYKLKP